MPAGGLVIAGSIGLAQSAVGLINKAKAKKEAARLQANRPQYTESPYAKDALSFAQNELSTGMSGEAKNAYEQGIDRSLSTSLSAIMKTGGTPNNIAEAFDASTQGRQRLALMKENLRLNQIQNVVQAQKTAEEQREKAFEFNQWAPWADAASATAASRAGAEKQIWSGIDTAGSALTRGISTAAGAKQLNSYFQGNSPDSGPTLQRARTTSIADTGTGNYGDPAASAPQFIDPSSFNMPTINM